MRSGTRYIVGHVLYCLFLSGILYQYSQGMDITFSAVILIGLLLLQIFSELNEINQNMEKKQKEELDGEN